jgi:O-antigen/teichoic acid export membrane protein
MMLFSWPYLALGALSFYINFGDRYFLRLYGGGLDVVGIYSLGYKFGFLLTFIVGDPFFNVWDSEKFRIYRENDDPSGVYRKVFLVYVAVLVTAFLGLSLFGRNVIMIMAKRDYWHAVDLIPVVCVAYAFNCMGGFADLGLLVKERTIELTYGTIIAAVIVSAGYLILIPLYGAMGAALATLLAFGARMAWIAARAKKCYDMKLDWSRAFGLWIIAGVIWKASDILKPESMYVSIAINIVAMMTCVCALLYLPILPADLRKEARKWLLNPRSSLQTFKGVFNTSQ